MVDVRDLIQYFASIATILSILGRGGKGPNLPDPPPEGVLVRNVELLVGVGLVVATAVNQPEMAFSPSFGLFLLAPIVGLVGEAIANNAPVTRKSKGT